MKVQYLDLIDSNETLTAGLHTLAALVEFVENRSEDTSELVGIGDLIKLIAKAGQHQTDTMQIVFRSLENQ